MNIIVLSDEDRNLVLSLLRREVARLEDPSGDCKRLEKLFESAPSHVYMALDETEIYGAWTNPRDVVMWILDDEPVDNLEDEMIKMLSSDYPAIVKVPVNPAGEPWCLSR